ncbi:type II toxin-antitoxin system RelE/ParE family toxin [Pseudoduganella namucuonensis]|uniref:ParE toxin of type II toxin-antitoxin system, parDE n=1 Tax=Pseudoduganella namucuonensis TaxID=1035707 RepID=A0A1I7LZB8_9BURK|nr:type II toxin-antitoxin system RelE/ParE family toxin [Pseudoduganella namucuonensis]SFV15019.1 ParE toxin of type II toxin-antitoxin system, parDE [Pseudoduganella namucuonensis]
MTKLLVLESAQEDFFEIRNGFRDTHTKQAYENFKQNFKTLFAEIRKFPQSGGIVQEAQEVGLEVRQRICEQIRVIYTYDEAEDVIHIRMFLPTARDFLAHLTKRILRPVNPSR